MTKKKKCFFLLFPCFFFFKVITEQVVVDANLPSVSKESVGQEKVGDNRGGWADAAPSPAHKGLGARSGLPRDRARVSRGSDHVAVSSVSRGLGVG